jgi:hypothetical protein
LYAVGTSSWTAAALSVHHYVRTSAGACQMTVEAVSIDAAVVDSVTLDRCGTSPGPSEVVIYAADIPAGSIVGADWTRIADTSAAAGLALQNPDRARPKPSAATASPASYVDVPFTAQAGTPYHVWFRMKAANNAYVNDSVFAQFSTATDAAGQPLYRIGTTSGASIILEEGTNAGVSGWGWNDHAYGSLAPSIYFGVSGPQTLRIQAREDGVVIDQIVISPATYLTTRPGATKQDSTVVAKP